MRTIVDLPEKDVKLLDVLGQKKMFLALNWCAGPFPAILRLKRTNPPICWINISAS